MLALIRDWRRVRSAIDAGAAGGLPPVDLSTAAWGAPVPQPGKIVAAPLNYRRHQAEMHSHSTIEQEGIFLKASSAVIGPGASIVLPHAGRRIDQEAELAVVIGSRARHVPTDQALDVVFGYTCLIDVTLRGHEERCGRKSFDTFAPVGPWVATADEVGDPGDLRLRCWVNEELRQDASTAGMIYDVRRLIAYVSSIMTLEPGDILSTGTPAGVGPLAPGDRVVVDIDRVGRLEVGVEAAWATISE